MRSKEALENWYNTESPNTKAYEYELHYRLIKKDLEMLELLKKHLSINCWGEIVYEPKHHYQYINDEEVKLFEHNEEDTKIKEWLKK